MLHTSTDHDLQVLYSLTSPPSNTMQTPHPVFGTASKYPRPWSQIDLEKVPSRFLIGKTQSIKWSTIAPSIAAMRTEARERFAATGAKGGREVSSYSNPTPDGADVTVGLEVADPKASPALGGGFAATVIAPPGDYLRDDHSTTASMATWVTFVTRIPKEGYELIDPLSIFEVYTGTGGKDEGVAMYAAVKIASE